MFWGLVLEPSKRYSTTVEKSFHVSMAALDCSSVKQDNEIMSVMLETEGQESLLCSLCKQKGVLQEKLDLNFLTGDTVTFSCKGSGTVHLSGYLVADDEDDFREMMADEEEDDEEVEEEESGTESPPPVNKKKENDSQKRKSLVVSPQQTKKKKTDTEEESDEENTDEMESSEADDSAEGEGDSDEADSDEMEDSDEVGEDEEEEDEETEEEKLTVTGSQKKNKNKVKQSEQQQQQQQNQKAKSQQNTPNKQQSPGKGNKTPLANGFTPKQQQQQQSGKKEKKKGQDTPGQGGQNKTPGQQKTPGGQKTPTQQNNLNTPKEKTPSGTNNASPQKRVLEGGLVVKDLRIGNGPLAKSGKMVNVYYTGRLKSSNKVFDSVNQGTGFKFRLGCGEVIKGWDEGVAGMKVGGKRLIICPAAMAYGNKGSPPAIPPNSTLTFEVELKSIN